jgi:hypothetical protein
MTKTILLATVLAVTILGLTSASMVFNNTAEAASHSIERVSVTVNLDDIKLKTGEVMVLLDTTGSGTLSTVHVAANLPCDKTETPQVWIVAGVAGPNLSGVIADDTSFTGFFGPDKTCVFHATVDAVDVTGGVITDVIILNPDGKSEKLKGVVVTITGTYI